MNKFIRKNDLILIGVLLVSFLVIALALKLTMTSGNKVVVSVDGEVVKELPLEKDAVYEIKGYNGGQNVLVIKDGEAYLSDASCPDHLCINMGRIKNVGQSIICLPNRVVVEIRGDQEKNNEYDTVTS